VQLTIHVFTHDHELQSRDHCIHCLQNHVRMYNVTLVSIAIGSAIVIVYYFSISAFIEIMRKKYHHTNSIHGHDTASYPNHIVLTHTHPYNINIRNTPTNTQLFTPFSPPRK